MEALFCDIFIEFVEIAIHYLIFLSKIYPDEIFECRKKYGCSVKYSLHPQVNSYISNCLQSARTLLVSGAEANTGTDTRTSTGADSLERLVLRIIDSDKNETRRFVFSVFDLKHSIRDNDHYLIQCEQNLRTFFLKLSNAPYFQNPVLENQSFQIQLHTNESAAVKLAKDPDLEHFPFIEQTIASMPSSIEYLITPIHTLNIDIAQIQIYMEHKED